MSIDVYEHVQQFGHRLVQDALAHALAAYWERRADALEACLPRAGDFLGGATDEAIEEHRASLTAKVAACRNHARLIGGDLG